MAVARKQNFAGYYDEQGRFRPIRSPQYVGTPKRKATARDKKASMALIKYMGGKDKTGQYYTAKRW